MTRVRWGISATGSIAHQFAAALAEVPDAELAAVASRTAESAARFGDEFGIPQRYASGKQLADDSEIDIVYVASPHTAHRAAALRYIHAGKHVLLEKPFALNEREARDIVDAAQARGVFVMEAIWSRFLPAYQTLRALVDAGEIGDVVGLDANFGFAVPQTPGIPNRMHDLDAGGGTLLDMGFYPVQLSRWLLGEPRTLTATTVFGSGGIDLDTAAVLAFDRGLATVRSSMTTLLDNTATIYGTNGFIQLPLPHHAPTSVTVVHTTDEMGVLDTRRLETPIVGAGLRYEVLHVHEQLERGRTESDVVPWADTLGVMRTLDRIRAEIGLRYPSE
ncbi:Gfo/Idh/MocA family protein [Subtercola endophyticus]|uniref:Gfo/Idh/MocA family protein n=1 Tax=Subtercola endophyticus TaxID=2895559 RepID=UPI001E559D65|nr:Gfo/Idh/MocA family oxidoreductase [Subtercola endophyticus]UFS58794.1 Gfo/Idh/MocA family oxidoreductase [Subtercola endophyticus]